MLSTSQSSNSGPGLNLSSSSQFPALKEGDTVHNFKVKKVHYLPKLQKNYYLLEHIGTKAQMIHIAATDANNCFAVGFRTTPMDSTGVAHILEHTVLCGSKKYPVRDPFFAMAQRSVNTFMNAFTASDWTLYPFCSPNEKDYYNLMDVYLDAVFYPILDLQSFLQEGHRLEFSEPSNPDSELTIKGIVYNEMKGSLSSPSSLLIRNILSAVYSTTTYHYNSGGDPEVIPSLTYEAFKKFHETFYHPSNSFFYSYGNLPLEPQLKLIDEKVLSHFKIINTSSKVGDEVRYTKPQTAHFSYPLDQSEDDGAKHQVTVNWLLANTTNAQEILALQLLAAILLGHAGSPLQKKLLESQLGKSFSGHAGFHDDVRETLFSVGLQGVKSEDFAKVENLILDTLKEVARDGIDPEEINSALHQMEFKTREITENFGLDLLLRFFGVWIHEGDALDALDLDPQIIDLKKRLQEKRFLEKMIETYFLNNPHRVTVTLSPDAKMQQLQEEKTKTALESIKQKLSDSEKKVLVDQAHKLKEHQDAPQPIHLLPQIEVKDLNTQMVPVATPYKEQHKITLFDRPSNGIFYLTLLFPMDDLTTEEIALTPLFGSLFTQSGTHKESYDELAKRMVRHTGGIGAAPMCLPQLEQSTPRLMMEVSTACLNDKLEDSIKLMSDLLTDWNFMEGNRSHTLIRKRAQGLKNSVVGQGHAYAKSLALRNFSLINYYAEEMKGMAQVQRMLKLEKLKNKDLKPFLHELEALGKKIFTSTDLHIVAVGDKETLAKFEQLIQELLIAKLTTNSNSSLTNSSSATLPQLPTTPWVKEAWTTTTPVSYVARAFKAPHYTHPDAPLFKVVSHILSHKYLHTEIREKGGAYGGSCSYSSMQDYMVFASYRDPNFTKTYDVYNQFLTWLKDYPLTQKEVEEGILQTISDLDAPATPADEAIDDYYHLLQGLTPELRQKFRDAVFAVKLEDVKNVISKWCQEGFSDVAVTSPEIIKKDTASTANLFKVHSV